MKLYFKPADLALLPDNEGRLVPKLGGQVLGTFTNMKQATKEFNHIRRDLEEKLPPARVSDEERRSLLARYLADKLVEHNSFREPPKRSASKSTRTFG